MSIVKSAFACLYYIHVHKFIHHSRAVALHLFLASDLLRRRTNLNFHAVERLVARKEKKRRKRKGNMKKV